MQFEHYVITRVNLRRPNTGDPDRAGFSLKVYATMLRASLRNQTCQDFTHISAWGRLHDIAEMPNELRVQMPDIPDQFHAVGQAFAEKIKVHTQAQYIAITRTDSDDALRRDFIAELHAYFKTSSAEVLPQCVDVGTIIQLDALTGAQRAVSPPAGYTSPFLTLLVHRTALDLLTPIMQHHDRAAKHVKVVKKLRALVALQCIHGKNIYNKLRGAAGAPTVALAQFIGANEVQLCQ